MNDNDFNEMLKKAQSMIQNNQIPDDIKSLINNIQNSNNNVEKTYSNPNIQNQNAMRNNNNLFNNMNNCNNQKTNINTNSNKNSYSNANSYSNTSANSYSNANSNFNSNSSSSSNVNINKNSDSAMPNIDVETLMKIQNIMAKMKNSGDDDMSKLLLSLKPYLRDGRKEKVDEYIKLIKMGKITQFLDLFGGEKK